MTACTGPVRSETAPPVRSPTPLPRTGTRVRDPVCHKQTEMGPVGVGYNDVHRTTPPFQTQGTLSLQLRSKGRTIEVLYPGNPPLVPHSETGTLTLVPGIFLRSPSTEWGRRVTPAS